EAPAAGLRRDGPAPPAARAAPRPIVVGVVAPDLLLLALLVARRFRLRRVLAVLRAGQQLLDLLPRPPQDTFAPLRRLQALLQGGELLVEVGQPLQRPVAVAPPESFDGLVEPADALRLAAGQLVAQPAQLLLVTAVARERVGRLHLVN